MNRSEILKGINEALEPLDEITEETVISECDDLDSWVFSMLLYF